jgi:nitroreductase
MQVIEALLQRRSGRTLGEPAPDDATLQLILESATRAPDHGRLRPWRFLVIRSEARDRFGELLAQHLQRTRPDARPEALERERRKALRAPLVIVVAAAVQAQGKIPAIEQVLSAGAAMQNMLLACAALGFGAVWKTGGAAYDAQVKQDFGLQPEDAIVGFLYVGTEMEPSAPVSSPDRQPQVRHWP